MIWTISTWIVLGIMAGAIATLFTYRGGSTHIGMNLVLGIFGAVLGGLVLKIFGITLAGGFTVASFVTAFLGAMVLLAVASALHREAF